MPSDSLTAATRHGAASVALQAVTGELARSRVLTSTGWLVRRELNLDEWVDDGRRLGLVGRGVAWWIGDWLRYGNQRYGERYSRAAHITGYDPQTLMNMVYVASRFALNRRRSKLSWSHHAELAASPMEEQEHWLDVAEAQRLSVRCLRGEIRTAAKALRADPERERRGQAGARVAMPTTHEVVCPHCQQVIDLDQQAEGDP